MERHCIDEQSAFEMLRARSRIDNRKLIDLATAVVDGHRPLAKQPTAPHKPDFHRLEPPSRSPPFCEVLLAVHPPLDRDSPTPEIGTWRGTDSTRLRRSNPIQAPWWSHAARRFVPGSRSM